MTAAERSPQPPDPAAARTAAAPPGTTCDGLALQPVTRKPEILMPPPDDHDADDIAGWSGVVEGCRGTGPLSRPAGLPTGPSQRW